MTDFEILGPLIIASLMSIGALCILIWAVLSGALNDADDVAVKFCRAEVGDGDARKDHDRTGE
jgi:hypothetical protein